METEENDVEMMVTAERWWLWWVKGEGMISYLRGWWICFGGLLELGLCKSQLGIHLRFKITKNPTSCIFKTTNGNQPTQNPIQSSECRNNQKLRHGIINAWMQAVAEAIVLLSRRLSHNKINFCNKLFKAEALSTQSQPLTGKHKQTFSFTVKLSHKQQQKQFISMSALIFQSNIQFN